MTTPAKSKPKAERSNIEKRRQQAQLSGDNDYRQRREQLSKAAAQIFREKGFDGASINDFAKAIGVDRASVYYYTSGKEEIFQDIVQQAVRDNVEKVENICNSTNATNLKLRELIVQLMRAYEYHFPYLFLYVQEDMARISSKNTQWAREMAKYSKRFDAAILAVIEEGIESGAIIGDRASAKIMALGIVGMCNWSHRWFRPSEKLSAEAIGHQFSSIILNGILAD